MIHINYRVLDAEADGQARARISVQVLKKARTLFGRSARKELSQHFDADIRLMATEIAQRQVNPTALYEAGVKGIWEALDTYDLERLRPGFREYALPFIRQQMINARKKLG